MLRDPDHQELRRQVRAFVDRELRSEVDAWEKAGTFPRELYRRAAEVGVLGAGYPESLGGQGGDLTHQAIVLEELCRSGSAGLATSLLAHGIALSPILGAGTEAQQRRFIPPVLAGEKIAALAVTEPGAGSDVQAIETRAKREGDGYRLNGRKVFITNGARANLITTLVRTGGKGAEGLTLLVIEAPAEGYEVTRTLEKLGWRASDTAELCFTNLFVPLENRIGKEGQGFAHVMQNFATERLFLAVSALAIAQIALEEALRFARNRRVFGKRLIDHQVTRHKLADMTTKLEPARTYVYWILERVRAGETLIKEAAIAKNAATDAATWIVDQALQLHGGYGFMEEQLVARLYRDIRLYPIGGGTREIMNELIFKWLPSRDGG